MRIPEISLSPSPDGQGWAVYRGSMRLGTLYRVDAGWVTAASHFRRAWRSKPLPTASAAMSARWGDDGLVAVNCETSEAA